MDLAIEVDGRSATIEAQIAATDLGKPLSGSPLVVPSRSDATMHAERAVRYVFAHIHVTNGTGSCSAHASAPAFIRERARDASFALVVTARFECARQIDDLRIRYDLFFDVDPLHQALARVHAFGGDRQLTFRNDRREAVISGRASLAAQFADYLTLGVEHIFTGYDHLAFLFGLLLAAAAKGKREGLRATLGIVTAFTVAHSITLITAALGLIRLPSRVVESCIALSIVYVAIENLRASEPRRRWLVAFAFGLVHGFGFASVLGDLGLPSRGLVLSLVAFNVGVEVGQLAVVCLAFPVLLLLARAAADRRRGDTVWLAFFALAASALFAQFERNALVVALAIGAITAAMTFGARRFDYRRGVQFPASIAIALLGAIWFVARVRG